MRIPAYLAQEFPEIGTHWADLRKLFVTKRVDASETLLYQGDVATKIFIVVHGAVRLCHTQNGRDISVQFFFENQVVSSFESFYLARPSGFAIESIEKTEMLVLSRSGFEKIRQR